MISKTCLILNIRQLMFSLPNVGKMTCQSPSYQLFFVALPEALFHKLAKSETPKGNVFLLVSFSGQLIRSSLILILSYEDVKGNGHCIPSC